MIPNPAIAEVKLGVIMMLMARSGWPRWLSSGQAGDREEAQRGGQGEAAERLELLTPEDVVERRDDERAGHQPGDVGVHHDHQAPVDVDVVGKEESGQLGEHQRTSMSRPR